MAATSLSNVKAIARGDAHISGLHEADPLVQLVLADVAREVQESVFGDDTEIAQRYLAAHRLAIAYDPSSGKGALSSESIGGVSQSFHQPNVPDGMTNLDVTIYGQAFSRIRSRRVIPAVNIRPAC